MNRRSEYNTSSLCQYTITSTVFNKTVVLILLLFSSINVANNAFSTKKLPTNMKDDTINGFSSLLMTLAKVWCFLPVAPVYLFD